MALKQINMIAHFLSRWRFLLRPEITLYLLASPLLGVVIALLLERSFESSLLVSLMAISLLAISLTVVLVAGLYYFEVRNLFTDNASPDDELLEIEEKDLFDSETETETFDYDEIKTFFILSIGINLVLSIVLAVALGLGELPLINFAQVALTVLLACGLINKWAYRTNFILAFALIVLTGLMLGLYVQHRSLLVFQAINLLASFIVLGVSLTYEFLQVLDTNDNNRTASNSFGIEPSAFIKTTRLYALVHIIAQLIFLRELSFAALSFAFLPPFVVFYLAKRKEAQGSLTYSNSVLWVYGFMAALAMLFKITKW
jgi:hypothetical protein